jgi:hypothetical protein
MIKVIRNLVIVGVLVATLLILQFRLGQRAGLSVYEISKKYHSMFSPVPGAAIKSPSYPYRMENDTRSLYLNLMKLTLTDSIYDDPIEKGTRQLTGWPARAFTMIRLEGLDNIQACMEDVLEKQIPGDFIEAGAWRGGATIFMRAILKVSNETTRKVWVADSFEGLPSPDPQRYPADAQSDLHKFDVLAVSDETVRGNFQRFGLLDQQVVFLKGWFKDTLPNAPIKDLAVLRIDADLYESTFQALSYLYPKLSNGGYVIIDDYYVIEGCRKATDFYRQTKHINDKFSKVGGHYGGIYWRKE